MPKPAMRGGLRGGKQSIEQRYLSTTTASNASTALRRAKIARQLTIEIFGWRYGRALIQADFIDRLPSDLPRFAWDAITPYGSA